MAEPFLGEIRMISWGYAPPGWALCNGQFLPINQNQALFSLLGTTFGGNGQTTFALPDFRGRIPIHVGAGHVAGERAGQETHTITQSEMPQHVHLMSASSTATGGTATPNGNYLGGANNAYHAAASLTSLAPTSITNQGGSQPHENRQPFLALNFMIALIGIFPSPT
jgi:microcystin-dependent protein